MVARGVGGDRVSPSWKRDEQDAGDHEGPHHPASSTLAPTDYPALCLAENLATHAEISKLREYLLG